MRLRPAREDDVGALVAACQDAAIQRYTRVPSPYTDREAREWIELTEGERQAGRMLWVLVVDAGDDLLGSIDLHEISRQNRRAEIGYWIAAEARGRGVATRAVRLIAEYAFEVLPLERIGISAEIGNAPSCLVAERAGFSREGVLRGWIAGKAGQSDAVRFSLLRSESAAAGRCPPRR